MRTTLILMCLLLNACTISLEVRFPEEEEKKIEGKEITEEDRKELDKLLEEIEE